MHGQTSVAAKRLARPACVKGVQRLCTNQQISASVQHDVGHNSQGWACDAQRCTDDCEKSPDRTGLRYLRAVLDKDHGLPNLCMYSAVAASLETDQTFYSSLANQLARTDPGRRSMVLVEGII